MYGQEYLEPAELELVAATRALSVLCQKTREELAVQPTKFFMPAFSTDEDVEAARKLLRALDE